jgi:peptidoglycan hydrolase CwlO-like protein
MRNKIGTFLVLAAVSLVSWIFLTVGSDKVEEQTLRMQVTLDSLRRANREHELHIMQLEHEVEDISDDLSDCTEDFHNCIAGRKIQIRHSDGSILTSNPEH